MHALCMRIYTDVCRGEAAGHEVQADIPLYTRGGVERRASLFFIEMCAIVVFCHQYTFFTYTRRERKCKVERTHRMDTSLALCLDLSV